MPESRLLIKSRLVEFANAKGKKFHIQTWNSKLTIPAPHWDVGTGLRTLLPAEHLLSDNIMFTGRAKVWVGYIKKINPNCKLRLCQRIGQTLSPGLFSRGLQPRRHFSMATMTLNTWSTAHQCLDIIRSLNIQQLNFPSGRSKEQGAARFSRDC